MMNNKDITVLDHAGHLAYRHDKKSAYEHGARINMKHPLSNRFYQKELGELWKIASRTLAKSFRSMHDAPNGCLYIDLTAIQRRILKMEGCYMLEFTKGQPHKWRHRARYSLLNYSDLYAKWIWEEHGVKFANLSHLAGTLSIAVGSKCPFSFRRGHAGMSLASQ